MITNGVMETFVYMNKHVLIAFIKKTKKKVWKNGEKPGEPNTSVTQSAVELTAQSANSKFAPFLVFKVMIYF